MAIDASRWLLTPISFPGIGTNGKPWGIGTNMNKRAQTSQQPWDVGCSVTPLIGGYRAMREMRAALEALIAAASGKPAGTVGHVYIADWRFNPLRDLSDGNPWATGQWSPGSTATRDQTAIGLVLRLMQAGVIVRILLWYPTPDQGLLAHLSEHIADHDYVFNVVRRESQARTNDANAATVPLGIVGLDARTTEGAVGGAHHQKMMVIRSPTVNVAFCGGVDLAFTRRDAPGDPTTFDPGRPAFFAGDWESGDQLGSLGLSFPIPGGSGEMPWPPDATTNYASVPGKPPLPAPEPTDLPTQTSAGKDVCEAVRGQWDDAHKSCQYRPWNLGADQNTALPPTTAPATIYGSANQLWHDQHLMLTGPIVSSLEWQFAERWIDAPIKDDPVSTVVNTFKRVLYRGKVIFSTDAARNPDGTVIPLESPAPEPSVAKAASIVQMWRTIPTRDSRPATLLTDGEFTVMSGYAHAMSTAQELIWIFDQYFWSEATARLLNYRLQQTPGLCVLVILPPFADTSYPDIHLARSYALGELIKGLTDAQLARVGIYNLWHPGDDSLPGGRGIYVHAKAHTYDGTLLVCGSANLNRRSLMCDSELACAVLDSALVAQHQQNLWQLLFGQVPAADGGRWPTLDLNAAGSGAQFLKAFTTAAQSPKAFVTPDPWVEDVFAGDTPGAVVLPNGLERKATFPGPVFEGLYAEALDPSSLDRRVEQDVPGQAAAPPRPPRLDDIVDRVERQARLKDGALHYTLRKQGVLLTGPAITFPAIVYTEGPNNYEFTENAEWWRQLCLGLPCLTALQWTGYATKIVEETVNGAPIVIQLWKGWCQRAATLKGMPGGVGAEVGVYRRRPDLTTPQSVADKLGAFGRWVLSLLPEAVTDIWWPYPELNPTTSFTMKTTAGDEFFSCAPESTWWGCKWMTPPSYDRWGKGPALGLLPADANASSFTLNWTIACQGQTLTGTW